MTSQESSITSQNSHRIVTLHHSHISLICVLSLSLKSSVLLSSAPAVHIRFFAPV